MPDYKILLKTLSQIIEINNFLARIVLGGLTILEES